MNPYLQKIQDVLLGLSRFNPETLIEGKNLGALNFRDQSNLIRSVVALGNRLKEVNVSLLPERNLAELFSSAESLLYAVMAISEFNLEKVQQNPREEREKLIRGLQNAYFNAFNSFSTQAVLALPIPNNEELKIDFDARFSSLENNIVQQHLKLVEQSTSELKKAEQNSKAIASLLESAQKAVAETGVSKYDIVFKNIADKHDLTARNWLVTATILGTLSLGVALVLFVWLTPQSNMTDPATIQHIITKIIMISILSYFTVLSVKNYKIHRHLTVVNEHRQNALLTFETFVKSTNDSGIKDAVLLEATKCIFNPGNSGYLEGRDDEMPAGRVIEILKTVTQRAI